MDVTTLAIQYSFEIIPDCPAATAAGYTEETRKECQVLNGPVFDEENFYYTAYSGQPFFNVFLPSILVARRKDTGEFVYATNNQDYTIDTGDTFVGPSRTICRTNIVVTKDRLYLTSGSMTNIGPQLFCLNKKNGALLYAVAYYLPEEVELEYGVKYLTNANKGDYSRFRGSNARISSLNPTVIPSKGGNAIFAGVSSFQNVFNPGLIPDSIHYTGYPFYTDQGFLFCIRERGSSAYLSHRTAACAPNLKVGDLLLKTGKAGDVHDPFPPGSNKVLIGTISSNTIVTPGAVAGRYFFAQKAIVTPTTVVNAQLFAPFWSTLGAVIRLGDDPQQKTLAQILPLLVVVPPSTSTTYYIHTSLESVAGIVGASAIGSNPAALALWYVKELSSGESVANKQDANGLGYWSNSVWGAAPNFDECNRVIYFSTGQSHAVPLSERLYFAQPENNYRSLKIPFVDATTNYVASPTALNLEIVNSYRKLFEKKIRSLCLEQSRSPRGQMSYVDAILAASPDTGRLLFAVRTVQSDIYVFLGMQDPILVAFPNLNDVDGDVSSGVFKINNRVTATSKNGSSTVLDVAKANRRTYNHGDLCEVGVEVLKFVYVGPLGILGGSNYQSAQDDYLVLGNTANVSGPGSDGAKGSHGNYEAFVSPRGLYVPITQSVSFGLDPECQEVKWYTPLQSTAFGACTYTCGFLLTNDIQGRLYALDAETGTIRWSLNAAAAPGPMKGGVASPSVDTCTGQVFWIASYNTPGYTPGAGKYGMVLQTNDKLRMSCRYGFLNGKTYTATAGAEKFVNKWVVSECETIVFAQNGLETSTYTVTISKEGEIKFYPRDKNEVSSIRYLDGQFFNRVSYSVRYLEIGSGDVKTLFFNYST